MKYSPQQKAEALESIERIGVAKTSEEMKIAPQTLYKWRREDQDAHPSESAPETTERATAKALLANDLSLLEQIERQEAEIKELRATLLRYKAALAGVLDGGK